MEINVELEDGVERVRRERKRKFLTQDEKLGPLISKLLG